MDFHQYTNLDEDKFIKWDDDRLIAINYNAIKLSEKSNYEFRL